MVRGVALRVPARGPRNAVVRNRPAHNLRREAQRCAPSAISASLIGRWNQALSDYPPDGSGGHSRARASLQNRHIGPSTMGFENEAEQSLMRPCQYSAAPNGHTNSPHSSSRVVQWRRARAAGRPIVGPRMTSHLARAIFRPAINRMGDRKGRRARRGRVCCSSLPPYDGLGC
jgi:hypothetical protein